MTDPFVSSEVDRTKSRWVARAFREFGPRKSTLRAFFYFCLQRSEPDYPICGGFVGEIRATRSYHQSDGQKLAKWAGKAQALGFLPQDAFLQEEPGEHIFCPQGYGSRTPQLELWTHKSAFNSLLQPVCARHGAALVSSGQVSPRLQQELVRRAVRPTTVLALTDLSCEGLCWYQDLVRSAGQAGIAPAVQVVSAGITPQQALDLNLPQVSQMKGPRDIQREYRRHLKPQGLDDRRMVELDALEVLYPGGLAAFADRILSSRMSRQEAEPAIP